VDARVDHRRDRTATVRFTITDTGIGIRPDQVAAVFSPFIQADASTTRKYGGTGLGLTICKQLVEMMGGTIGVTSQEGQGSAFTFTTVFELAGAGEQQPGGARREARFELQAGGASTSRTGRILVAEDNAINREVALAQLKILGYTASAVTDGSEAIEALRHGGFDLVLMDCQMPVMDGFEATRRIRSSGERDIPIIAVTADAMAEDRNRCLSEGMNDYLAKPVELGPLDDVLARWLPRSRTADTPAPGADAAPKAIFDGEVLLQRLMGDRQVAGIVIKGFLEGAPSHLDKLRDRLDEGDVRGAREQAQALKGLAAAVAADGLHRLALAMEEAGNSGQLDHLGELMPRVVEEFERFKSTVERTGWV
jgi:CheY-like chemotaxis protein